MSAIVIVMPSRARVLCRRCGGMRHVTYEGLTFACPECGDEAEVIPFEARQRARNAVDRFEQAMIELCNCFREG